MRIQGWEARLSAYIRVATSRPFSWGQHDCALWCAGWVKECTGEDYADEWIGQYSDEDEAVSLIRSRGFDSFAAIADAHLEAKPVMLAQRGDIVLRANGALGICNGRVSHFIAPNGMIQEPTLSCIHAWKVG